jgi:hypothetical protein
MRLDTAKAYRMRARWVQSVCPAPKRYLQTLILQHGLKTGLDIGCGEGSPLTSIRGSSFRSTGIDIDLESVERARQLELHDDYIVGDFMSLDLKQTFDVIVMSHVIEHFDRDTGWKVLQRIEEISRHLVYVETPHGFLEQTDYDGNPYQRHLSGWFPHDFQSRGYTVFGSGAKWMRQPMGTHAKLPQAITRNFNRSLQWFYFRRPQHAGTIAGIRFKDKAGNLRWV